ncbi:MAG TPA: ECF-type sigma factor [Steroidobacter sp.]|uniref:ECF-type sigma factor n=1 Tax=Steroidobacter sp. TaxID=1978227 RepID=UPI002ED91EA8
MPDLLANAQTQLEPLIRSAETGDASARQQLFGTLYGELRRIAQRELRQRGASLTLGATTLLHEAYLNIAHREGVPVIDRSRFLGYASRAMRGLVIDYARARQALKRGSGFDLTSLPTEIPEAAAEHGELERIGEAVETLADIDPALAQVVDLKFFCGYSFVEIAAMRGVSERTVQRDWEKARIFLHRAIQAPSSLI